MRPYVEMDMFSFYVKWMSSLLCLLLGVGSIKGIYVLSYLGLFGGIGLIGVAIIGMLITCVQYSAEKHDLTMTMISRSRTISVSSHNSLPIKIFTPSPVSSESDSANFSIGMPFFATQVINTPHRKNSIFKIAEKECEQQKVKKTVKFSDDCAIMDNHKLPVSKNLSRNSTS